MTIRTLIVDDEPVARRGIRNQLRGADDIEVVAECGHGAAAVEAISDLEPDLVFLDVQMPEMDGFDVVATVGAERMPAVIFVTAFDQFAVRAFDVHAIDYVLKPINRERFLRALERARQRLARPPDDVAERVIAALADLGRTVPSRNSRRLAIKQDGRVILVDLQDVVRIEAAGNYVEIHAAGKAHLMRETLAHIEARLDPARFVRVSRSSIVSVDRVRELRPMFNGDFVLLLQDGSEVSGSRRFRHRLEPLLNS